MRIKMWYRVILVMLAKELKPELYSYVYIGVKSGVTFLNSHRVKTRVSLKDVVSS